MAKTKETPDAIDPAGEDVVIYFAGDKVIAGVPARDLSGGDLARLAYVRAHHATDWTSRGEAGNAPALPSPATAHQLAKLADELVDSGVYRRTRPSAGDVPGSIDTTTEAPATPADTTEG